MKNLLTFLFLLVAGLSYGQADTTKFNMQGTPASKVGIRGYYASDSGFVSKPTDTLNPHAPLGAVRFDSQFRGYIFTGTRWQSISGSAGLDTAAALSLITWSNLQGKPATFPPATHGHGISDITGLQSVLDSKAALTALADTAANIRSAIVPGTTIDTSSLSNRINQRVKYNDTAAMLVPYATKAGLKDTAAALRNLVAGSAVDTTFLSTRINQRVKHTDTAAMLAVYATKAKQTSDSIVLANGANIRVKYTDTSTMLLPYSTKAKVLADSTAAALATNARVKYTDTAAMLTAYAKKSNLKDTAAVLRGLISSGASLSGYTQGSSTGNTAVGVDAAPGPLTDFNNTNIGYLSGYSLQNGGDQVAVGAQSLRFNVAGIGNVAVGAAALRSNTQNYNTGVGFRALFSNTTGTNNGAFGYQSLNNNLTGQYNYGFGSLSLYSNTDGRYNVGVGDQTVYSNTSSWYNTAVGSQALYSATGALNTGIGYMAGSNLTTGSGCLALGSSAQLPSNTADNQVSIKNLLTIVGASGTISAPAGRVGIGTGTTDPVNSAILELSSNSKGFLKPRMTTTERTSIPSPAEGLEVYDLTLHKDFTWDGTSWQAHW